MGARYDNIAGVQHKVSKRSDNINGIWRPVSKRYDNIAGVWRQGYSRAVEWTYAISKQSNTTIDDNNHANSIYFYSTGQGTAGGGSVTYAFPNPLVLPAGSTLDYYAKSNRYQKMIRCIITVNGTQVFNNISTGVMSGQIPYPSGITLNSVTIEIDNFNAVDNEAIGDITITPYGGAAFKLTFLNSAEL